MARNGGYTSVGAAGEGRRKASNETRRTTTGSARGYACGMDAQLVVLAVSAGTVATTLVTALRQWLKARRTTSISIRIGGDTLKLDSLNTDQAERIIEQFLAEHPTENLAEHPTENRDADK
jgi:hypothetical protein